jgi:hypothetical protein
MLLTLAFSELKPVCFPLSEMFLAFFVNFDFSLNKLVLCTIPTISYQPYQ